VQGLDHVFGHARCDLRVVGQVVGQLHGVGRLRGLEVSQGGDDGAFGGAGFAQRRPAFGEQRFATAGPAFDRSKDRAGEVAGFAPGIPQADRVAFVVERSDVVDLCAQ
jgi:hypothetical protein